jgi:hypothetical protein
LGKEALPGTIGIHDPDGGVASVIHPVDASAGEEDLTTIRGDLGVRYGFEFQVGFQGDGVGLGMKRGRRRRGGAKDEESYGQDGNGGPHGGVLLRFRGE